MSDILFGPTFELKKKSQYGKYRMGRQKRGATQLHSYQLPQNLR